MGFSSGLSAASNAEKTKCHVAQQSYKKVFVRRLFGGGKCRPQLAAPTTLVAGLALGMCFSELTKVCLGSWRTSLSRGCGEGK